MKLRQTLLFLGFILGIGTCSTSFPSLGGYQRIDAYEVQDSVEIQQFINLGLQSIVQDAYSNGQVGTSTVSDYQLQKINSIYKQVLDRENYKFDCEFKGAQNVVIKATFEVHFERTTRITNVQTYSYDVKKEDVIQSVQDSYVQVGTQEVQYSTEIQNVLDYGVTDCVKKSIDAKQIANSKYEIATVNSVYKQVVESALFYKCDVDLKSKSGSIVQATFTVYYHPFLNFFALIDYLCNEKVVTDSGSTTNSNSVSVTPSTQVQVSSNNKQQDTLTNSLLQYGIDQILKTGIQSEKIPNTPFTLVEITSFSIQTSSKGKGSYKFKCSLQNTKGSSVQMTFTVSYQTASKKKTLSSWSYNIRTVSQTTTTQIISPIEDEYTPLSEDEVYNDAIIEGAMQYGIDEIIKIGNNKNKIPKDKYHTEKLVEAYSQVVGNWIFYKFTCTLRNTQGNVNIKAAFTISYQIATTKKKLTEYSYNVQKGTVTTTQITTTTTTTQSVEGQYIQCTEEEINNDLVIQDVLSYGTQQIYLRGVQDQKIPKSNFEITTINSVYKQVVKHKGTFYKCDLVLDNSIGSTLTMTFTVLYQANSQQKSISQWSYHISTKNVVKPTSVEQGSYVNVDISTAQTNAVIQDSLNYGIDQILQKALQDRKINDVNYDITKVVSISKKSSNADTYYKCQVELSNTDGSVINMDFNAYYETRTKKKTLKSYSYDIKTVSKVVQPIEAAYTTVSQSEIDYTPEIKTCLDYGIDQIIQSPEIYSIKTINSVQRQIADSALYYKFDVDLVNDMDSTEISFKFTVFYKVETGERYVKAYSYNDKTKTKTTTTTTSNVSYKYNKIVMSKVQSNSKYQSIINSGVKDCLQNLYDKQVIATKDFTISEIVSFSQQITSSEKYRCRTKLSNAVGISLEVSFEVTVKSNGSKSLSSYAVEGYTSASKRQALVVDSGVYDNYGTVVGSYDRLESTEINNDSEVKACIDYGVNESVKKIVKKEKYSVTDFKVKEIKSVCRDSVNQDTYRVESTLVNSKGATIDCSFLVKNQNGSGAKQLSSYAYTAY